MLKVALAGLLFASGADAFAPLAAPAMGVRARATARVAPANFAPRMLLGGEPAQRSTMKMLPAAREPVSGDAAHARAQDVVARH